MAEKAVAAGQIYGASNGRGVAYISPRDVGEVAAAVLADPEPWFGQVLELTGPVAVPHPEVARPHPAAPGPHRTLLDPPPRAHPPPTHARPGNTHRHGRPRTPRQKTNKTHARRLFPVTSSSRVDFPLFVAFCILQKNHVRVPWDILCER